MLGKSRLEGSELQSPEREGSHNKVKGKVGSRIKVMKKGTASNFESYDDKGGSLLKTEETLRLTGAETRGTVSDVSVYQIRYGQRWS